MKKQYTFQREIQCTVRFQRTLSVGSGSDAEIELARTQFEELARQPGAEVELIPREGSTTMDAILSEDGEFFHVTRGFY